MSSVGNQVLGLTAAGGQKELYTLLVIELLIHNAQQPNPKPLNPKPLNPKP